MFKRARRRRRHRNAGRRSFSYNRRHSRRRRRNAANGRRRGRRGRRRGHRRNPSMAGVMRAPLAGYAVPALKYGAIASVGYLGNSALSGFLSSMIPVGFIKSGIGKNLFNIATAGLLGAGVGMVNKQWGAAAFGGAMTQALVGIVGPLLPRSVGGTGWLGDYLTVGDAASARALGDYLTVGDAAGARALGGYGGLGQYGETTISEELASL